jgi:hypothetical protein
MQPSSVNDCGVLIDYAVEIIAEHGRSNAVVEIAMDADHRYRIGVSMSYSYGGFGWAPSMSGHSFETYADALNAGIHVLLKHWHRPFPSDPASVHAELHQLHEQVLARRRQPSLF